jgi:hypothetical protein
MHQTRRIRHQRGGSQNRPVKQGIRTLVLEKAKSLLQPSARSGVPPFMVMDVMAAAARLEAQGRRIVHMEVGQPAAGAPTSSIAAARAALADGPHGYTEALGMPLLRQRIARKPIRNGMGLNLTPNVSLSQPVLRPVSCWLFLPPLSQATGSRYRSPAIHPIDTFSVRSAASQC